MRISRCTRAADNQLGSFRLPSSTSAYTARRPFSGVLVRSERLTPPDAPKDTRHHVLSLAGSSIAYQPGDALGIWPANPPALVEAIIGRLGLTGDEPVAAPNAEAVSLREGLLRRYEL